MTPSSGNRSPGSSRLPYPHPVPLADAWGGASKSHSPCASHSDKVHTAQCFTHGHPTGGERTWLSPTLPQVLVLKVSLGHSRTPSRPLSPPPPPPPGPPVLPPSLLFLAGFSLHPGRSVPPPGLPGADESPTEPRGCGPGSRPRRAVGGRPEGGYKRGH